MTQCCNLPLYNSDAYCPKCGNKARHTDCVKSAFDIDPTITDSFDGNGEPFTGQVIDTYYYRRNRGDIEYGYLWLTLEDTNKKIRKFSINGEGEKFQNIKIGDILSTISPEGINLYYPISSGDDDIISNNISPAIVTFHREDNANYSTIDSCISDPEKASPTIFNCMLVAVISIGFAWYMYTKQHVYIDNPWFISACILPIICFFAASRTRKINNKKMRYAQAATDSSSKLENVFYSALGYQNQQRPSSKNDILCPSCTHAIDSKSENCCQCGTKVQIESIFNVNNTPIQPNGTNSTSSQQTNCSTTSPVSISSTSSNRGFTTVKTHNKAIAQQYELTQEHTFIYKHTLMRNKEHTVYCAVNLVKVVAKHMGANADAGAIETTHTTNYRNVYGVIVDSKTDTTYKPYRNLILAGYLTVENSEGELYTFDSNDYILRSSNVGDLLYIGECTLKRQGKYQKFLEYVYHVNKDEVIHGNDSYDKYRVDISFFSAFNCCLIMLLSIPTLGIPFIFVCIVSFGFKSQNTDNRNNTVAHIKSILKKCITNRSEILKSFK